MTTIYRPSSMPGGGGGYSGFQVKDFFGFEIFGSGIFLGTKIWLACVAAGPRTRLNPLYSRYIQKV